MTATRQLLLSEANELLSAWAQLRAADHGIRLLLIKGRTLADDGLRAPRTSADVDVLVDPARFDEYCAAVLDGGWEEMPSTFASDHFTLHSRSFRRDGWPNSFDVHSEYPGFLRDPGVVFDALWAGRRTAAFAHQDCFVPSRAANLLILALHSVRGTHEQGRHRIELDGLRDAQLTDIDRQQIADIAEATGAALSLRDVLPALGVEVRIDDELLHSAAYRKWRLKVSQADGAAASWLDLLLHVPWREKPTVIWRAVWPSRQDTHVRHPDVPDRFWPMARVRFARWGRGLRQVPVTLASLRRS